MACSYQGALSLKTVHEGAAGSAREGGIHVGAGAPAGFAHLDGVVRRVAQDETRLPLR